jgi:predicted O-linked N-acetylglucosamine transferase (SPINDLY family)
MGRTAVLRRRQNAAKEHSGLTAVELCEEASLALAEGNLGAAERAYVAAIGLGVQNSDTFNNLAAIYDKRKVNSEKALDLVRRAFELAPESLAIRGNYLRLLQRQIEVLELAGKYREALPLHLCRVAVEPESAAAQHALGRCYTRVGQSEVALRHYARAINLEPNNQAHYNDLGLACFELRLLAEAQGAFQKVLELNPKSFVAFNHLGLLANLMGVMNVAVNMMRRAVEIAPNCGEAHNNLALFLREQGELSECRLHYEKAIRLNPDREKIFSGYLLSLNDDPAAEPGWVAAEHRRFEKLVRRSGRELAPRSAEPERRLRVGYISPDFRMHSVGYFIAPLLEAHAREVVEVTCYATGLWEDEMTERIRRGTDRWRKAFGMSDDDLALLIQEDQIDVIIELSGHTGDNRLAMLAERVAPVQVTYLGYPNTTGLSNIDYRITDAAADPPGVSDAWCTEKLVRIGGGFLAYSPPPFARDIQVAELPAGKVNHITFGSFNNLAKINDAVLDVWAAILAQAPQSRLLIKARGLRDDRIKVRILNALTTRGGVAEDRVCLMGHERSAVEHLRVYNHVDVTLDTFPYNGTTTTCEALWMGVPVLTLSGRCHAGRVGESLMSRVGLTEFVTNDVTGYIEKAVSFSKRWEGLAELRSGLRQRLLASPLMDARRLASGLEAACREAWRAYCRSCSGGLSLRSRAQAAGKT